MLADSSNPFTRLAEQREIDDSEPCRLGAEQSPALAGVLELHAGEYFFFQQRHGNAEVDLAQMQWRISQALAGRTIFGFLQGVTDPAPQPAGPRPGQFQFESLGFCPSDIPECALVEADQVVDLIKIQTGMISGGLDLLFVNEFVGGSFRFRFGQRAAQRNWAEGAADRFDHGFLVLEGIINQRKARVDRVADRRNNRNAHPR